MPIAVGLEHPAEAFEQAYRDLLAARAVVFEQHDRPVRRATPDHPHPFVGLGRLAGLLEHLEPGLVCLEVVAAELLFAQLWVYRFRSRGQLYLLGHTREDAVRLIYLEAIGRHENFYRDLKC